MTSNKPCKACNLPITGKNPRQEYCDMKCRRAGYRKRRNAIVEQIRKARTK